MHTVHKVERKVNIYGMEELFPMFFPQVKQNIIFHDLFVLNQCICHALRFRGKRSAPLEEIIEGEGENWAFGMKSSYNSQLSL